MKKVTLTVPWGQYDPTVKKPEYKHSLLQHSFPPKQYFTAQVCTQISTNRHDIVLGTFEYIEADTHTAFSAFCRQLSVLR